MSKRKQGDKPAQAAKAKQFKRSNLKTAKPTQAGPASGHHVSEKAAHQILEALRESGRQALNIKQLRARAGLKQMPEHSLLAILKQLIRHKRVEQLNHNQYRLLLEGDEVEGRLSFNRDGFGEVWSDTHQSMIRLASRKKIQAFHGDWVRVAVADFAKGGGLLGDFVEVLQPARTEFAGTLEFEGGANFFIPQDNRIKGEFTIPNSELNGAVDGQKVAVELIRWRGERPVGRVKRILGEVGEHKAEMHAILLEFGLKETFPDEVEREARKWPETLDPEEVAKRRDFRNVPTCTIDPEDAKDFDDALSLRRLDNGNWEVGVHIADVSHYVRPNTNLDREAYDRGTSVYLVDRTVPMLPEYLSNNLCSLVPKQDRFTFSAVFELDEQGKLHNEWFGRTVIHSNRRFAYAEAQERIETGQGDFAQEVQVLNRIAEELRRKRFAQGSISFEQPELKFRLDEDGKPLEVYPKERQEAHKMIEDFMLLANRRVARFVHQARKEPRIPFVYRIHDKPDAERLNNFSNFAANFGYNLQLKDPEQAPAVLNELTEKLEGRPEQRILQQLAIRTMAKAEYSPHNIGHYGLGFTFYTHFTSPIRRYPDLLVHRVLQHTLDKNIQYSLADLERQTKYCSERERHAVDAERSSTRYKQVEFLQALLGKEQTGLISGLTNWGMYVELDGNLCEGMVGLRDLPGFWQLDDSKLYLRERRSGKQYRFGERVRVKVTRVDLTRRQADFELLGKMQDKHEIQETVSLVE